jgi:hypothetical protein
MSNIAVQRIHYVYQYVTQSGVPFYVGKGCKNRINAVHRFELPPVDQRIIIKNNLTMIEAFDLEMKLIRQYGRKIDGGLLENIKLNQWACAIGWHHSDDTKKRISNSLIGKTKSELTKQKMMKPKSAMHKQKIKEANIGRPNDGRYIKIGAKKREQRWFTNGINTIMIKPELAPAGYVPGRIYQLAGEA